MRITAAFMFKSKVMSIVVVKPKRLAKGGHNNPHKTREKPHKVIRVANGTIKILAKTVMGAIMRKLYAIIHRVPNQAENETKHPSQMNLNILIR